MCRLLLMTIAVLMILFGISGLWVLPKLIQQKIEERIQLKIGTKMYDRFTKVPIPLTVKFYLFNVTNSEQVLAGSERPVFEEVGPFVYKQWRERNVVDFIDNNRLLRYKEKKTFYPMFKRQQSRHNSDTITNSHNNNSIAQSSSSSSSDPYYLDPASVNVTIINLPLLSVLTKFAQLEEGSFKRNLISKIVSRLIKDGQDKILITRPANQILFDGYKVDFMESARELISDTLGFNFVSPLPANKFGFFYLKNGTTKDAGELTVYTGRNDSMNDYMLVENWNDLRELNVWPTNTIAGNRCNQIKGTDGSQFHPGVTRDSVLAIFSPMVCRSLFIKYKEDVSTRDIPLLRFGTPAEIFEAPRKRPENACFCTINQQQQQAQQSHLSKQTNRSSSRITDSRCYLDGLMDLSLCQKGAPVAASSPHFYNADPMLSMAAGLKPDKELHETFLDIEPMTGSVFRAASRAQLNAFVEKAALDIVDSKIIGHMTPMVAPMLWLEERGEIDDKSSAEFKNQLLNTVHKAKRTFRWAVIVGIVLIIVVSVQYWYVTFYSIDMKKKKNRNNESGSSLTGSKTIKILKGKRLRDNIRLSTGARKSNLAAKLANLDPEEFDSLNKRISNKQDTSLSKSLCDDLGPTGGPVIALAGVLGAVAGPSGKGHHHHLNRRGLALKGMAPSGGTSPASNLMRKGGNYNNGPAGELSDDELSKRMLMGDEWEPGAVSSSNNTDSSARSSNVDHNEQGADNHAREPLTNQSSSGDEEQD